jgi:hypothetical protein
LEGKPERREPLGRRDDIKMDGEIVWESSKWIKLDQEK